MPSPEKILAVVQKLEARLPSLLGTEAASVQSQLVPLKEDLAAGRTDGEDLLQQQLEQSEQTIRLETSDETYEISRRPSQFQRLAGYPITVIAGTRYICPESGCSQDWFQIGLRTPPLCEQHGVVMVLATDKG